MSKKNKKNKKIITILICICIIALVALLVALQLSSNKQKQKQKEEEYEESIQDFQEFSKKYEEETILPRKLYVLYKYTGEYDRDVLYKNMKVFVDYMDYLKDNVNSDNYKEFYSGHKDEVLETLGIEDEEAFKTFVDNLANRNLDVDEFKYAEIKVGSSYTKNGYFHFVLNLYYGDNEELNQFNVAFAENEDNKYVVSYEFCK